MIFKHDHPPPHVHILGGDGRAKIRLDCTTGGHELEWHIGIQRSDMKRILDAVENEIERLCREWRSIHEQA